MVQACTRPASIMMKSCNGFDRTHHTTAAVIATGITRCYSEYLLGALPLVEQLSTSWNGGTS